jgi:hypothetical protein
MSRSKSMSESLNIPRVVVDIPQRMLEINSPSNVSKIIDWVNGNPQESNAFLTDFDRIIKDFNTRRLQELDPTYINCRMVKEGLDGKTLPTMEELLEERGITPLVRYRRTLEEIRSRMLQGDLPEDERTKEPIGYHHTDTQPRNLVIAGIFHTYEMLIRRKEAIGFNVIEEDRIVEALMEVASEHRESPLFTALSSKDGMNWVDGYNRFDPEFRKHVGFS